MYLPKCNWPSGQLLKVFVYNEMSLQTELLSGYDNFREFIGDPEAVDNAVAERMLLEALYKALDQLSESDCDLIRALYFEGKTLSEYGEEKGCAISTLSERRKRILRDLKKVLKNFAE